MSAQGRMVGGRVDLQVINVYVTRSKLGLGNISKSGGLPTPVDWPTDAPLWLHLW